MKLEKPTPSEDGEPRALGGGLKLFATVSLLQAWHGPVLVHGEPHVLVRLFDEARPGGHDLTSAAPWAWVSHQHTAEAHRVSVTDIELDLARTEVRTRVARVVANALYLPEGVAWLTTRPSRIEPRWPVYYTHPDGGIRYGVEPMGLPPSAILSVTPDAKGRSAVSIGAWQVPYKTSATYFPYVVDGLRGLDTEDDTRVGDGTKRVDALALAIIARALLPERGV